MHSTFYFCYLPLIIYLKNEINKTHKNMKVIIKFTAKVCQHLNHILEKKFLSGIFIFLI